MNGDELSRLRLEIDEIDSQLIDALALRIEVVRKIGELKRAAHLPARDDTRWKEVVQKVKARATAKGVPEELVEELFNVIHKAALTIESQ